MAILRALTRMRVGSLACGLDRRARRNGRGPRPWSGARMCRRAPAAKPGAAQKRAACSARSPGRVQRRVGGRDTVDAGLCANGCAPMAVRAWKAQAVQLERDGAPAPGPGNHHGQWFDTGSDCWRDPPDPRHRQAPLEAMMAQHGLMCDANLQQVRAGVEDHALRTGTSLQEATEFLAAEFRAEAKWLALSGAPIYEPLRWILRRTPRPQAAFAWTQIRDIHVHIHARFPPRRQGTEGTVWRAHARLT